MNQPDLAPGVWPADHMERVHYRAAKIVCGMRTHSKTGALEPAHGEWSPQFFHHPLVRQAIVEGWESALRIHLLQTVRRRILQDLPVDVPDQLMPGPKWCEYERNLARRYAAAAEFQKAMEEQYGTFDRYLEIRKPPGSAAQNKTRTKRAAA